MSIWIMILIIYLAIINIVGFIIMGVDKRRAINDEWRIPEKSFFIVSLIGGSIGSWAGMYVFHHKTRHWYFVVFIPSILAAQIFAAALIITKIC